jgi:hypothetical protein
VTRSPRARRGVLSLAFPLLLSACPVIPADPPRDLNSFQVDIKGWYQGTGATRVPLPVVSICATRYGGSQSAVPAEEKGTKTCPYAIPRGEIEVDVVATALTAAGAAKADFASPVSYRIVPGDLTGDYPNRWSQAQGGISSATIRAAHPFSEVRVWAENAPPKLIFADGGIGGTVGALPVEPQTYTYAGGLSKAVFFEDPTIAKIQIPDGFDNRSSPFVGEFMTIGKTPESGEALLQSCADDKQRDQKPALMVVTGTDPGGFFVTDVSACRQLELTTEGATTVVRVPEPKEECLPEGSTRKCVISGKTCSANTDCNSYLPGTFGSMFIYNYSFPEGLSEGDLLFTIAGAAQEFTSTTQFTFPSWVIAEKVRQLPEDQWTKWIKLAPPVPILGRTCGGDNTADAFLTDALCGHNRRNLKMESLESGLVRVNNVRFPTLFAQCDVNGDVSVPFFCEQKDPQLGWLWGSCAFGEVEPPLDAQERQCHQDCVFGAGPYQNQRCAEKSTFSGFGQFPVEMSPYGLSGAGMDESLPLRFQIVPLAGAAARSASPYQTGQEIAVGCEADAYVAFGDSTVTATSSGTLLLKGSILYHRVTGVEGYASVIANGTAPAGARCSVTLNTRTLINLVVKDAIPELQPDCSESDPDATKAHTCQVLHEATFDVVGHLRHVQPARPRWVILPRDVRDVCCHPGPSGECPRPIQKCP